jgi:type IV pilus assembly protein PilB
MSPLTAVSAGQSLIVQLLLDRGLLDSGKLDTLREAQARDTSPPEVILVKKGLAGDRDIARAYADYLMLPLFEPEPARPPLDRALARLLPEKLCRDQWVVPVAVHGETLELAFVSPQQMLIIDEVQLLTGLSVAPVIAARSVVEALIDALYASSGAAAPFLPHHADEFEEVEEEDDSAAVTELDNDEVLHLDVPPPPGRDGRVIRLVNQVLDQALRVGASDIHLEPLEGGCKVRLRIDGVLHEIPPPPRPLFLPVLSRFKILAKMDIAEKRVPQDGAIALRSGDKRVDLRVSTIPAVHGEKMVIRILDKGAIPTQLTALGFDDRQAKDLVEAIQLPNGLMLATGPTGSGKSTTLYACLNLLNEPGTNICTVEDPVEYRFKGINQVQVKGQVGLTFATALRAFLRQDPDVIMVGEVRDPETAQICLRAALTGHFVLSTIHTNDALSAVSRLQDMGIEPFLVAATLRVLEAQRLIRRLCKECKKPYACDRETARMHGLDAGAELYQARGCDACRGTGYRGRVGVFEVVRITSELADMIQARTPLTELRQAARARGVKMLADSALDKAREGLTSLEEALSATVMERDG